MRFKDRVTIVTGGGSGLGRVLAHRFAAEGAAVVVADVARERAVEVAEEIIDAGGDSLAQPTDVTDASEVKTMVEATRETFGPVDVLINNAAKAGILSLTRSLAVLYGPSGIRVNAIAPGTLKTPAWEQRREKNPYVFERLTRWYPLGRVGEPDDVAGAALFLASDDAAWITGAVLPVDGGLTAGNMQMMEEMIKGQGGQTS